NDLSLVIKMTAGDKTLLFLGDAGVEAGKWLYDTYQGTNELKADFVQMAHHGQAGVEENVYGLIQPKYAFFNCDYAVWNNTSGKLKTLTVRGWIESLGATAYCSQLGANSVAGDSIVYIFR
ncbi:MAG: MBL fold metallo-hydrolase, partial [Clostridia bacterium]|nr:MBL fold metallo-hydrolase [Clostridia bacterium]